MYPRHISVSIDKFDAFLHIKWTLLCIVSGGGPEIISMQVMAIFIYTRHTPIKLKFCSNNFSFEWWFTRERISTFELTSPVHSVTALAEKIHPFYIFQCYLSFGDKQRERRGGRNGERERDFTNKRPDAIVNNLPSQKRRQHLAITYVGCFSVPCAKNKCFY